MLFLFVSFYVLSMLFLFVSFFLSSFCLRCLGSLLSVFTFLRHRCCLLLSSLMIFNCILMFFCCYHLMLLFFFCLVCHFLVLTLLLLLLGLSFCEPLVVRSKVFLSLFALCFSHLGLPLLTSSHTIVRVALREFILIVVWPDRIIICGGHVLGLQSAGTTFTSKF